MDWLHFSFDLRSSKLRLQVGNETGNWRHCSVLRMDEPHLVFEKVNQCLSVRARVCFSRSDASHASVSKLTKVDSSVFQINSSNSWYLKVETHFTQFVRIFVCLLISVLKTGRLITWLVFS